MTQDEKIADARALVDTIRAVVPGFVVTFSSRPLHPGTFLLITARDPYGREESYPVQACTLVSPEELAERCIARCRHLARLLVPAGLVAELRIGARLDGTIKGDRHGEAR